MTLEPFNYVIMLFIMPERKYLLPGCKANSQLSGTFQTYYDNNKGQNLCIYDDCLGEIE